MSFITLKCKNCGSSMTLNTESRSATCTHCGSTFLLAEILDEKDMDFSEKNTPQHLEQKMYASDAIKQGETFLFQSEYDKAEMSFKKAIQYDDQNFRAFLGVVKAKTHNLNIIPENDDYIQYANIAMSLATDDDLVFVKSELAKIELLKHEKDRQRKSNAIKKRNEEKLKSQKRGISKVFAITALFVCIVFGIFIFLGTTFFKSTKLKFSAPSPKKEVSASSASELKSILSDETYLNYEINITADLDFQNEIILPYFSSSTPFSGVINGGNHTISNLKITPRLSNDNISIHYYALFGYTKNATIQNLVFDNVSLVHETSSADEVTNYYAIVAGKSENTTFKNIEIKDTCRVSANCEYATSAYVGGLVGYATNQTKISNISCHSDITSKFTHDAGSSKFCIGGIIGYTKNSTINTCCCNSDISVQLKNTASSNIDCYTGGIIGCLGSQSLTDSENINHNLFSGTITETSTKVNNFVSAIAGNQPDAYSGHENYCWFTLTSFNVNSTNLPQTELNDYKSSGYLVKFCINNNAYISRMNQFFSSSIWKNTDTFTPNLIAE